ncbi:HAD family hydrolase [Nocardioides sp. CCNWLW239]|uniref:HAD family hydrolase n=1 Tax=Nocardioides sp. CCNWLW239 TaxID=3128902 RepID=UPI0030190382
MDEGGVRAILFGLHDTLIPGGAKAERAAMARGMGAELGIDPPAFAAVTAETLDERTRGLLASVHHTVRYLSRRLGANPSESQVEAAIRRRLDFALSLHAATWALPALRALRTRGFGLGLVSDSCCATTEVWPDSPLSEYFGAVSFSCQTGVRKPDAGAYLVAAAALEVPTTECVYVGDGGDGELHGAEALGMRAVRFLPDDPARRPEVVPDVAAEWNGPTIGDLNELVAMVGVPTPRDGSESRTFVSGNVVPWGSKRTSR